ARIRGFPNRRKDASLPVWARSHASRFLLKIGSGLRDWSRTATRRRRSYGGRGLYFWPARAMARSRWHGEWARACSRCGAGGGAMRPKGWDGLLKAATRPPGRKPLTARKIKQVVNL